MDKLLDFLLLVTFQMLHQIKLPEMLLPSFWTICQEITSSEELVGHSMDIVIKMLLSVQEIHSTLNGESIATGTSDVKLNNLICRIHVINLSTFVLIVVLKKYIITPLTLTFVLYPQLSYADKVIVVDSRSSYLDVCVVELYVDFLQLTFLQTLHHILYLLMFIYPHFSPQLLLRAIFSFLSK